MRTMDYINQKLKEMGTLDTWGTKKEIKELPSILHDNEELLYITSGTLEGNTWSISCTNERVIFLDKGMIFGLKQKEIPLDRINSIEHSKGLVLGKIAIWDGAAKFTIENIVKATVDPMVSVINRAINDFKNKSNTIQIQSSIVNDDVVSKLERLAKLKEQGILDEEEFKIQKYKILNN